MFVYGLLLLAAGAGAQYGGAQGGCADTWNVPGQCGQWAQTGECNKNPYFMNWKCKQSCGTCGGQSGGNQGGQSFTWPSYTTTSDGCFIKVCDYAWKCLQPIGSESGSDEECMAACVQDPKCKSVVVCSGQCQLYGEKIDFGTRAPKNTGSSGSTSSNFRFLVSRVKRQAGCGAVELCETAGNTYYELAGKGGSGGSTCGAPATTAAPASACPDGQTQLIFQGKDGAAGEDYCLDLSGTACAGPGYLLKETVLVGFAKVAYTVGSLQECFVKCATETSFDCAHSGSGLYFAEGEENCILNEETEATQPDQIAPNPGSDYFELRC